MITGIELTKEHEVKLLEMCKKLFEDKNNSWFQVSFDEVTWCDKKGNIQKIHWFEFCLTHLAEKIYKSFFKIGQEDDWYGCHLSWAISSMYNQNKNKIHLVDYLYKEFKKLK